MALKTKLTKTEFDALPDALKEHYKEVNGNFLLDSDEAGELRRAKERADEEARTAREEAARLKAEKDAADEEARNAREEAARKKGDTAALEASWQEKLTANETRHAAEIAELNRQIDSLTVTAEARRMAGDISVAPDLLEDAIAKRLRREIDADGKPVVRVLDASGQPSAKTIAELEEEFIANPKYAAIMIGSKGNGGGASGSSPAGGGASKKISEMTEAERVTYFNQVGQAEFDRRVSEERTMA